MRPLSDGERAILAQDGPEDPADDYRPLGHERRGVSSGRRTCTACRMKMPAGTPWVASFGLWERDCGTRVPVYRCHCAEGECPQTERWCVACDGRGGYDHVAWFNGPDGEDVSRWSTCVVCDGTGRVAKAPVAGGRAGE